MLTQLKSPICPAHIPAVTIYDFRCPDIMFWLSAMEPDEAAFVMTLRCRAGSISSITRISGGSAIHH
jgi:hypothetical protein